jgi:hypothetical protein
VDQPVDLAGQHGQLVGVGGLDPRRGEPVGEVVGQRLAAVGVDVDEDEPVGGAREQRVRDRRARATCAELHHLGRGHAGQAGGERRGEARGVGVVAGGAAVGVEDHGVDRPEPGRPVLEVVEVGEDQPLARVGHVEGVVAEPPRPVQQLAHLFRRETEVVEVEGPVDVVEAVVVGLAHVHRGGQRRADAGADEADQGGAHPRCS